MVIWLLTELFIYIYVNKYYFMPKYCLKCCLLSKLSVTKDNQAKQGLNA
jgi:hypothetical protein